MSSSAPAEPSASAAGSNAIGVAAAALTATLCSGAASKLALLTVAAAAAPFALALRFVSAFSEDALVALVVAAVAVAGGRVGRAVALVVSAVIVVVAAANVGVVGVTGAPVTVALLSYAHSLSPALLVRRESALALAALVVIVAVAVVAARTATRQRLAVVAVALAAIGVVGVVARIIDDSGARRALDRHHLRAALFTSRLAGALRPDPSISIDAVSPEDDDARRAPIAITGHRPVRHVLMVISESTAAARATPKTMPTLAALAADHAVSFVDHSAESPISIKSLFALMCGVAPFPDAALETQVVPRVDCHSLPERLQAAGFRAGLFHGGYFAFTDKLAFFNERGFDVVVDGENINAERHPGVWKNGWGTDDRSVADEALFVLDQRLAQHEKSLTVVVPLVPHYEYFLPKGAPRPFGDADLVARYNNGLHFADGVLRTLWQGYIDRGLADDTLVVFVGDHGEAFDEHPGNRLHGSFVYDENLTTPLVMWGPGVFPAGAQQSLRPSTHADVAPTIEAVLGLDPAPPRSLSPIAGQDLLSSTFAPRPTVHFSRHPTRRLAVRGAHRTLVVDEDGGQAQLFARDDVRQHHPLNGEDDVVAGMWAYGEQRLALQRERLLAAPQLGDSYMARAARAAGVSLEERRVFNMVRPCLPLRAAAATTTTLRMEGLSPPVSQVGFGVVDESRRRREGGLVARLRGDDGEAHAIAVSDVFERSSVVRTIAPSTTLTVEISPSTRRATGCLWLAP